MTVDGKLKVRENNLRRAAGRQGLRMVKSRRRDPRATDYGGYGLTNPKTNKWVAGEGYSLTLDELEKELTK